jgi:hypothetical protein
VARHSLIASRRVPAPLTKTLEELTSPYPSVIYRPAIAIFWKKLENLPGFWNNIGGNTSSIFQDQRGFRVIATLRKKRQARKKRFFQDGRRRLRLRLANVCDAERPKVTAPPLALQPGRQKSAASSGVLLERQPIVPAPLDTESHQCRQHLYRTRLSGWEKAL